MLRKPTLADVKAIARLANDRRIAENTRRAAASLFRRTTRSNSSAPTAVNDRDTVFLIEHDLTPVGMVGLDWREPDAPELGYWLGVEHWGQGFGTEAARAVIDFTLRGIRRSST